MPAGIRTANDTRPSVTSPSERAPCRPAVSRADGQVSRWPRVHLRTFDRGGRDIGTAPRAAAQLANSRGRAVRASKGSISDGYRGPGIDSLGGPNCFQRPRCGSKTYATQAASAVPVCAPLPTRLWPPQPRPGLLAGAQPQRGLSAYLAFARNSRCRGPDDAASTRSARVRTFRSSACHSTEQSDQAKRRGV